MTNKGRWKGTKAERATATALKKLIFPDADRRTLSGRFDKGDLLNTPGVCFEVKDAKMWKIPEWMTQTARERFHAEADYGILVVKMPGVSHENAHRWLTVMDHPEALHLFGKADWFHLLTDEGSRQPPRFREVVLPAVGVQTKGVAQLLERERHCGDTPVVVNVRKRLMSEGDSPGYWNLMRLDARCRVLLDAGYGTREIMG